MELCFPLLENLDIIYLQYFKATIIPLVRKVEKPESLFIDSILIYGVVVFFNFVSSQLCFLSCLPVIRIPD